MSDSKFAHRRRNAPPVRRSSWGKRQLVQNTPEDGRDGLSGLPTVEEFKAFFSSVRGLPVKLLMDIPPKGELKKGVGITFATAEGKMGGLVILDVTSAMVLCGAIRRLRAADIRRCIETETLHEEVIKALQYLGRRMADMVSSTDGPRLYFQEVTEPNKPLPGSLRDVMKNAEIRMGFQLDLSPHDAGQIYMALNLA